ncbi:MAG TPA: NAD(P)H-dependent oxidoreductase subunit E [Thermoleophilaceae bacterium]|nr:NAD(P)H-dependent oxidoreductase subunit E [Thermoleophilaceae bacterium]
MDLRQGTIGATVEERDAVATVLGPAVSRWEGGDRTYEFEGHIAHGGHDARAQRHLLLPVLQAVQARVGWISEGALEHIAERLTVPHADVYGVATFYGLLTVEPRAPRVVHVCDDVACRCAGSDELIAQLEQRLGPEDSDSGVTWLRSPCLGQCDRAPAAVLTFAGQAPEEHVVAPANADELVRALHGEGAEWDPPATVPQVGDPSLRLLRRVGVVSPGSLDDYRSHGGYAALRRAFELGPEGVIREVKDSGLVGRGGAAFPTGVKWEAVAHQPVRPHYVVANADESEPGTFKDRVVMEGDPFSLIESMTIAAFATGCEKGYVYLRGEYPQAHHILGHAIELARAHGFLGDDVFGHEGFSFDIEIRSGAGAYICGEETAIFNSIEGFRGEPRSKPPFPVTSGLFGKPTVVNNVETLVNVLQIVLEGGPAFASIGSGISRGPRLFCLSGCVERPGVYEVPFGTTLGDLVELAGGVAGGRPLQAILLGGAAGAFVGPDALDLDLTIEAARERGTTLGSGVVMLLDDRVDIPRMLLRIAAFFRDESCGQCVPCRVGTVRQEEALARLISGRTRGSVADELALLDEIGDCMTDASICGLGQTAYSALKSAVKLGAFS